MTVLLFNKHPLVVDKTIATVLGLNQAMILQQIHYWLEQNKKNGRNFHQGKYWTYNTISEWQEEFPFWSKETVKRAFKKLREAGILKVDNFNVYKMDRTLWYTIDYEKLSQRIGENYPNEEVQNDPMEEVKATPPIPETTTKTSTEISNHSINQVRKKAKRTEGGIDLEQFRGLIDKCELYALDENYREAAAHAIKLLLLDSEKGGRVKMGENYYPAQMVKDDLEKLDFHIVQHGVKNFQKACEEYEIKNPIPYLKACIYNAIYEMEIEVDKELRLAGLI